MTRLPAYTRETRLASGETAFYWELPSWAKVTKHPVTGVKSPTMRGGVPCPLNSTSLGTNKAAAIQKAENLNEAFREWRIDLGSTKPAEGTIAWMFTWYRQQERFTKNEKRTKDEYRRLMDMLVEMDTDAGKLGRRKASRVDASLADALYQKLKPSGMRQAAYAMQVCRLVWGWAIRHYSATGLKESQANPFAGMSLEGSRGKGNRETSRAEYTLYKDTARALGYQSMATAAAISFECCQRVWDAFGLKDPEDGEPCGDEQSGALWENYAPGESLSIIQSKTGNLVTFEMVSVFKIEGQPEIVELYPELEKELALSQAAAEARAAGLSGPIVVEERSGKPYKHRRMSTVHREICEKAGLPKDMTFTGFRHGGITELGDMGESDVRAVSGHKTLDTTKIYNKASAEKGRRIALKRREHVRKMEEKP